MFRIDMWEKPWVGLPLPAGPVSRAASGFGDLRRDLMGTCTCFPVRVRFPVGNRASGAMELQSHARASLAAVLREPYRLDCLYRLPRPTGHRGQNPVRSRSGRPPASQIPGSARASCRVRYHIDCAISWNAPTCICNASVVLPRATSKWTPVVRGRSRRFVPWIGAGTSAFAISATYPGGVFPGNDPAVYESAPRTRGQSRFL